RGHGAAGQLPACVERALGQGVGGVREGGIALPPSPRKRGEGRKIPMLKTLASLFLLIVFGLLLLGMVVIVVVALGVSLAALAYRLMPGANVPLGYTLRNIRARWINTAVIAAAFALVIGILTVMLAFVTGMYN